MFVRVERFVEQHWFHFKQIRKIRTNFFPKHFWMSTLGLVVLKW